MADSATEIDLDSVIDRLLEGGQQRPFQILSAGVEPIPPLLIYAFTP